MGWGVNASTSWVQVWFSSPLVQKWTCPRAIPPLFLSTAPHSQEHYTEDAYRLLSCCILCSRTSGGNTVKDAVAAFFKACPTPTRVLSADQGELRKTLLPLGLNR